MPLDSMARRHGSKVPCSNFPMGRNACYPGLSGKIQTTITHSLEAFAGNMNFTELADQLVFGAMGSSPSSTAAYLMYTPG